MSDPPEYQIASDRSTAGERVPIDPDRLPALPEETVKDIGLNRRQSRTIAPPRKWRMHGLGQRICPECRAIVPGIPDGFWHLQTAHNQGKGVDLEAWANELRAELDEYIRAAKGRRGYITEHEPMHLGLAGIVVLIALVALAAGFLLYLGNGG